MTIKIESNYGNYATKMSVELEDESLSPLASKLVEQGLFNINYRVAGSAVDKALGVDPKNGGRRGVEYSDEGALKVIAAVEATLKKLELPEGISFDVTGKYEYGEGGASAMVRATTFVDELMGENEEKLRAVLGLYDEAAAKADRDGLIAIAHAAGVGKQVPKAKK